jgi:hypothetical protein
MCRPDASAETILLFVSAEISRDALGGKSFPAIMLAATWTVAVTVIWLFPRLRTPITAELADRTRPICKIGMISASTEAEASILILIAFSREADAAVETEALNVWYRPVDRVIEPATAELSDRVRLRAATRARLATIALAALSTRPIDDCRAIDALTDAVADKAACRPRFLPIDAVAADCADNVRI